MKKINIVTGALLIVFALAVAILPQFTDCLSEGRSLTTTMGKSVPMKCHWTAIAEMSIAIPLGLVGVFTILSRRNETRRAISGLGIVLGALVILFPTYLIGVCANPNMDCNKIMRPGLILSGALAIAACALILFNSRKFAEPAA